MPYITEDDREKFLDLVEVLGDYPTDHPGELNYIISTAVLQHLKNKGLCYATLNEIMGVLDCVAKEFYRRVVVPYEDKKIEENGDLPGFRS